MLHVLFSRADFSVGQHRSYGQSFLAGKLALLKCIRKRWKRFRNFPSELFESDMPIPSVFTTGSGAGKNLSCKIVFSEEVGAAQHSSSSHLTICRKYWLARTCIANHACDGSAGVSRSNPSSPFSKHGKLINNRFIPYFSKCFSSSLKVGLLASKFRIFNGQKKFFFP